VVGAGGGARMIINLHIDRVVVDGVSLEQGSERHVRAAVERELSSLLMTRGVPTSMLGGGAVPGVRENSAHLEKASTPTAVGREVARSIYGSLSQF
jgi:hypothetical protein